MKFNIESSALIANACDEYFLYRAEDGSFFIRYTKDFYIRNSKLIPEFSEMKEFEVISKEEAMEHLEDIRNYYGKSSVFLEIE